MSKSWQIQKLSKVCSSPPQASYGWWYRVENRKAVNEWMLENPDLAPQTSSSKQGKIKLKIKDEVTGQGSIIKLEGLFLSPAHFFCRSR